MGCDTCSVCDVMGSDAKRGSVAIERGRSSLVRGINNTGTYVCASLGQVLVVVYTYHGGRP